MKGVSRRSLFRSVRSVTVPDAVVRRPFTSGHGASKEIKDITKISPASDCLLLSLSAKRTDSSNILVCFIVFHSIHFQTMERN